MATATLLDIGDDLRAFLDLLNVNDGELTPESEAALDAFFAEITERQAEKVDAYVALIRSEELLAAGRQDEVKRLQRRVKVSANLVERLEKRLQEYMHATSQKRIVTKRYQVGLVGNGGKVPLKLDVPAESLPPRFQKTTIEYNLDALRAALAAGETIAGVTLGTPGTHLRIS